MAVWLLLYGGQLRVWGATGGAVVRVVRDGHGVFSMTTVLLYAVRLSGERFVIRPSRNAAAPSGDQEPPSRKLSMLQCSFKLFWHMLPYIAFSTAAEVVGCYMLITHLPLSGRKYKPAMYMNSFWSNFVLAGAEFSTRNIFISQTVRGLARQQLKDAQLKKDGKSTQHRSSRPRRSCISSARRFLAIYVQTLPSIVSSVVAIVYVHSISLFASINRESELVAFAIGSIALKLTMQEMAKRHLLSTKTPLPRRLMIILVSTPTILVDTQVRMLLMRLQDVSISVLGSAMLAFTEITVRAVKSMLVHRDIQQLLMQRMVPAVASAKRRLTFNHSQAAHGTERKRTPVETPSKRWATMPAQEPTPAQAATEEITARQQRHLIVHAAEIYADMYAEYMAMGCSYAIMFFFWNHPQYQFVSAKTDKSEATQRLHQFFIFAFQVSVEVVVDFFACNLETLQGVDFGSFDQNDPFLTFFMSMLAFANVSISAGLYIQA
jgi:hypothetical protein